MTPEMIANLRRWEEVKNLLKGAKPLVDEEMALRKKIFSEAFAIPTEGTNTFDLGGGWKLKGTYKIERKVNQETLDAVRKTLADLGVAIDPMLKYEPKLVLDPYRAMSDEHRAIFNATLSIKAGSPILEVIAPKPIAPAPEVA